MAGVCAEYRNATDDELQRLPVPGGARFGAFVRTLLVECHYHLPWALARFREAGGKVQRRPVARLQDLAVDFDVLLNCTGLGAGKLCDDPTVIPVRGQVYKV